MDIIGLHYYNITHAKIILTEQKRVVDYISKQSKNKVKMHEKYQYNRLDATHSPPQIWDDFLISHKFSKNY